MSQLNRIVSQRRFRDSMNRTDYDGEGQSAADFITDLSLKLAASVISSAPFCLERRPRVRNRA